MKPLTEITHEFVEHIPDDLKDGVVYVSVKYPMAAHKCCCGCGNEVITPFTPARWKLVFDGKTISLDGSIGNWNFPCQSHYFIQRNKIHWADQWSKEQIDAGRYENKAADEQYFAATHPAAPLGTEEAMVIDKPKASFWQAVKQGWLNLIKRLRQ